MRKTRSITTNGPRCASQAQNPLAKGVIAIVAVAVAVVVVAAVAVAAMREARSRSVQLKLLLLPLLLLLLLLLVVMMAGRFRAEIEDDKIINRPCKRGSSNKTHISASRSL